MSGIAGHINNMGESSSVLLESMTQSMQYSKNDRIDKLNDDFIAISRVHHAIINPEPQPIFNEDKSMFIVMVGEVFEYEEQKLKLIESGHEFGFEDNDAEYCLHLYEEKGKNAFKELNGSFFIAIYNLTTHELLLVNDRFSSHSLFYYLTDKKTLLFGTQLSSILQSSEVPRELNIESIFEFFTFERVLGTKTYYKDINLLPPATILHYRDGNISIFRYWEMKYKEEKHPEEYYVDKLAAAIKKSVESITQGNYRFGLLLSGGLDSRMILAASHKEMVCFTFGDYKNREYNIAKRIAEVKGCKHVCLKRETDHYINLLDEAIEIGGGMYGYMHAHTIGFFDQIQKECDVLLHGYVPELFFRGTSLPHRSLKFLGKSFSTKLDRLTNENLPYKIINTLKYSLNNINPQQLFIESYLPIFNSILLNSVNTILNEAETNCTNVYDKFLWFDTYYQSRYPSFLFATSIRSFNNERSIVFDNDLLDLHLKMPVDLRSNNRIWMKALAKLDPEIAAIPDANTGYSPVIPEYLEWVLTVSRKITSKLHLSKSHQLPHPTYTQGSWPDFFELIRHNEKMKKLISDTIKDPECLDPNIFDIQRVEEMFKEHLNGEDKYTMFLYLLLTFGKWHKKYGPRN